MESANAIVGLAGAFALVIGALVARLPVDTCRECPHCRARAERDAAEQRRLRSEYEQEARLPRRPGDRDDDAGRR